MEVVGIGPRNVIEIPKNLNYAWFCMNNYIVHIIHAYGQIEARLTR